MLNQHQIISGTTSYVQRPDVDLFFITSYFTFYFLLAGQKQDSEVVSDEYTSSALTTIDEIATANLEPFTVKPDLGLSNTKSQI